jgi:UMF1 family MFS transporter
LPRSPAATTWAPGWKPTPPAAAAQAYWGWGLAIASILIAVLAPILGAIADSTGRRLIWVWVFSVFYVVGSWALWWVAPGGDQGMLFWAVCFFGIGFIGMEFATIFTNALMPTLSDHDDLGAISGSGFAFGYLGGLLALIVMLLLFAEGADSGKTLIGLEPAVRPGPRSARGHPGGGAVHRDLVCGLHGAVLPVGERAENHRAAPAHRPAMASLRELLASLRYRRSLSAYLASSLFYRDALNALYGFGGVYASGVLGWSIIQIGTFGVVGAVSAMVAAWLGGRADRSYGPKPVIAFSIVVLILVCMVIVGMDRDSLFGMPMDPASGMADQIFFACGALIGAAGGTVQAASRTMMVRHTTPDLATEALACSRCRARSPAFCRRR